MSLSGNKTHITVVVILILLFGSWQKWWVIPNEVYFALMAAAASFLRLGMAKVEKASFGTPQTAALRHTDEPLDSLPEYPPAKSPIENQQSEIPK